MSKSTVAILDIGSNAIRLYLASRERGGSTEIFLRQRAAVRLGASVFSKGLIDAVTLDAASRAIDAFHQLALRQGVSSCLAIATSATREASNREVFCSRIQRETGIVIEVISGEREAELLARAIGTEIDLHHGSSILVDLGGGSLEIARVEAGRLQSATSLPLGAIRLKQTLLPAGATTGEPSPEAVETYLDRWSDTLRESLGCIPATRFVAVGGNIKSLVGLAGTSGSILTPELRAILRRLASQSATERAQRYALKADRADCIVVAGMVYARVAELAGADLIAAPDVSLGDALVAEWMDCPDAPSSQ